MAAYRRDLTWAQEYAARNRAVMLALLCGVLRDAGPRVRFAEPVSCHHNYVVEETHAGVDLLVTRKGAIRAGAGELGIIPGSMGTGSYIVRGLGNEAAYCSASHGAVRRMSPAQAKRTFTVEDLAEQTAGVECRKDSGVIDEIPGAYEDLADVIRRQDDLVEVVAHLKQVLCVKGRRAPAVSEVAVRRYASTRTPGCVSTIRLCCVLEAGPGLRVEVPSG
jgi:tRNA-splicing ligase RtcB